MKNTHLKTLERDPRLKEATSTAASTGGQTDTTISEIKRVELLEIGNTSAMSQEKHVYMFLKALLYEWQLDLDLRSEEEKRSAQGKLAWKNYIQCRDYLKPLFKKLKHKVSPWFSLLSVLFHELSSADIADNRREHHPSLEADRGVLYVQRIHEGKVLSITYSVGIDCIAICFVSEVDEE